MQANSFRCLSSPGNRIKSASETNCWSRAARFWFRNGISSRWTNPKTGITRWAGVFLVLFLAHGDALSQDVPEAGKLEMRIETFFKQGKYAEAIPVAKQLLEIREKTLGPDHTNTAASLNDLADLYHPTGDFAKAEPLYQRALKIVEKALGPEHPDTATCLNNLAVLYIHMRDYAKAEPLHERALKIKEKALGPEHLDMAVNLNNLAKHYTDMGSYAKAEALYQRMLKIVEKALGPEHPTTATCLNNLATLYVNMGDYARGEPLLERALKIQEKALGPEHAYTVASLHNLATLYMNIDDYAKAEPLLERALKIQEKALGPEHRDTAVTLHNLATFYINTGDYAKAERLLGRVLKIQEKALGPEHRDTAASLNTLATFYADTGDYAKAEPLYQRALTIHEKAFGPDHRLTATSLNNLAVFYLRIHDYARAEPLLERALKIHEKALDPEHREIAASLNSLALLYRSTGEYTKAEPLYQRALKIHEKALGPEHRHTAASLDNLAMLYQNMGDYAKAEPLYQRALKIQEKALGPEHRDTAASLNNLGLLYHSTGDYTKAEPLLQRALKIYEKALGPVHPGTAMSLQSLGLLLLDEGRASEASQLAREEWQARLKTLANILSFTSEAQRLAYMAGFDPYSSFASLGNVPESGLALLRCKGVVLDSLVEDRLVGQASANPEDRATIDQMRSARQRAYRLMLAVPKDLSEAGRQRHTAEREQAQAEAEQLEGEVARRVAGLGRARRALSVTVEQVQSAIPKQGVLIESVRYRHYLGTNRWETRYGAVILASAGDPKWVSLGATSAIATNLARSYSAVRMGTEDKDFLVLLKQLYQQLWAPIEKALSPDTKLVIISPDADLNFVSFATLLAEDSQFLGQKYSVRYVSSGRDLLREVKPSASSEMVVYANPDFSGEGPKPDTNSTTSLLAMRAVEMRDFSRVQLTPLPGAAKEGALLETEAKKWNWPTSAFSGAAATEAQLYTIKSPRILHLATHGFFLPQTDNELGTGEGTRGVGGMKSIGGDTALGQLGPKSHVVLKNPMHRSGLALAGAQATLEAWKRGEVPPTDNDGIVTAEEVGSLKLEGTWVVTLSACDTGTGEARSGEGVLGLRRGFIQAGAQNLLMALWPVTDDDTPKMMRDFYEAAHESGNVPKALAEVQRDWLVKLRKERGLAAAVRIAGPFIMSSQGAIR